jgi:uroporphyrinogen-III synthase
VSRRVLVLRPEPGNARTVARLAALGLEAVAMPLFEIVPLAWDAPDPDGFDALLLTSANAVRHAGAGLRTLAALPVVAVGAETARAAEEAGLTVALTGAGDAAAAVAQARAAGGGRLLHLSGRDHVATDATAIAVYASMPRPAALPPLDRTIALLHSRRAAEAFAALVPAPDRSLALLVAISPAALAGAGEGWAHAEAADAPTDAAMAALALRLARD